MKTKKHPLIEYKMSYICIKEKYAVVENKRSKAICDKMV